MRNHCHIFGLSWRSIFGVMLLAGLVFSHAAPAAEKAPEPAKAPLVAVSPAPAPAPNPPAWMALPIHPSEVLEGRGWRLQSGITSMVVGRSRTMIQLQAPGTEAVVLAPGVSMLNGSVEVDMSPTDKGSSVLVQASGPESCTAISLKCVPFEEGKKDAQVELSAVMRRPNEPNKELGKVLVPVKNANALVHLRIEVEAVTVRVLVGGSPKPNLEVKLPTAPPGKAIGLAAAAGGRAEFGDLVLSIPFPKGLSEKAAKSTDDEIDTRSMNDVLAKSAEASVDLKTAQLEMEKMIKQVQRVNTGYLPSFKIDAVAPDYRKIKLQGDDVAANQQNMEFTQATGAITMTEHTPTNTDITVRGSRSISSTSALVSDRLRIQVEQEVVRKDTVAKSASIAEQLVELQKVTNRSIHRTFVNQVKRAYYNYLEARDLYNNTRQRYRDDVQLNSESAQKYTSGIIAEYNRLDYQRDFQQSASRMVSRETTYLLTRKELFYILHETDNPKIDFEDLSENGIDNIELRPADMLQAALTQSLDVANLNYALFSNRLNVSYLRDQLLPSVKFRAGTEWGNNSNDIFDDNARKSTEYFAGVGLIMPFFAETFATNYSIQIENAEMKINELNLQERFRYYKKELQRDIINLENAYRRYRISRNIANIATKDYDLSRKRFEVGAISSWDMIRSKNEYYNSLDELSSLRFEVLRQLADIERDYPLEEVSRYATR